MQVMGLKLETLTKVMSYKKRKEGERSEGVQEQGRYAREAKREHVRRVAKVIKKVVKEPDELPPGDDVPAVKKVLEGRP